MSRWKAAMFSRATTSQETWRSRARAMILSSTSVKFRTKVTW
jgi:hypothetical protein